MKKNTVTASEISAPDNRKYERITFFRSFWEAIAVLGPRNRLLAYEAVLDFGLNNVRRENLPYAVEVVLRMAIPQMRASQKRYRDGSKGKPYGALGANQGKDGVIAELNTNGELP